MNTTTKLALITFLAMGMLVSCAQPNPHPMDMTVAVQSAKTKADHEALAEHYEQTAKDAQAKVKEHKKLLDEYKAHSYFYGKQIFTLESHCQYLIQSYGKIAEANMEMAKIHRQMAGGVE